MNHENAASKNKSFSILFILGTIFYAVAVILESILEIALASPLRTLEVLTYQCVDIVFNCIVIFGLITICLYISKKSQKLYTPIILYIGLVGNITVLGFETAFYLKNSASLNVVICIINCVIKAFILLSLILKHSNSSNENRISKMKIPLIISVFLSLTCIAIYTAIGALYTYTYIWLSPLMAMMEAWIGGGFEEFAEALDINLHIKNLLVFTPYFLSHLLYLAYMFSTLRKDSKKSSDDKFVFRVI